MMKLPDGWYVVFESKELSQKKPRGETRFGLPVVAYRDQNNKAVIISDLCPHRRAKLSLGQIIDGQIECPFHGLRFDHEGKCRWIPEVQKEAPNIKCRHFVTYEKEGWVWIWWGESSPVAEPTWYEDLPAKHHVSSARYQWPVHFTRAVENQLDYSHLPYVHRTTIGRFSKPTEKPHFRLDEKRLKWWMKDGAPFYIEFIFPNYWQNRLSPAYSITLAFVPIDENNTLLYLRTHRKYAKWPPFSWIADFLDRIMNKFILGQDRRVVVSQEPTNSMVADEILLGSDNVIRHFREWLKSSAP